MGKKFRVHITSGDSGYFDIEAEDADSAQEKAQDRIENGDISWINERGGWCETGEVEEIKA